MKGKKMETTKYQVIGKYQIVDEKKEVVLYEVDELKLAEALQQRELKKQEHDFVAVTIKTID